jgi:hypothetical protein
VMAQPPAGKPNGATAGASLSSTSQSELNGTENRGNRTLVIAEPTVPGFSEPASVPAKNGAASIGDLLTRAISQGQLKNEMINQRLDRLEAETERRNQLLSQAQAAGVQKDRLIAALQDRIVETEREREEFAREARHWRDHVLQFRKELEVLPLLHRKEIAMDTGSGVLVLPTSEPGHFLFGPYLPLQEGRYNLIVRFRAAWVLRPGEPILTVEIAAGDRVLAEVLATEARDVATIEFAVPSEAGADPVKIEFRFSHHANASLEIREAQLSASGDTRQMSRLRVPAISRLPQSLRLFYRAAHRA